MDSSKIKNINAKNSKVLFISLSQPAQYNGGKVISERNLQLLQEYFGENSVYNALDFGLKFSLKNRSFYSQVKEILKEKQINIVFLDNSLMGYFPREFFDNYMVICFLHNVESLYAKAENSGLKGMVKSTIIRKYERENYLNSDINIAISERDACLLEDIYHRKVDFTLASSMKDRVREESALKRKVDKKNLLFVGTDFFGNTEGLFWFIENCMPRINAELRVVGSGMDKYKDKYSKDYKTEFIGFVDDLGEEYIKASALVLPIISGYGMKTKTCEGLMYGKKIFGTSEAFSGFDGLDNEACSLCKDAEEFVQKINAYIESEETSYKPENRDIFLSKYSYEASRQIFSQYLDDYFK